MAQHLPNQTRLFIAGMFTFGLTGVVPAVYGLAVPSFARAYDMTESQAGVLISAHGGGAFLLVMAGIFGLPHLTARLSLTLFGLGLVGLWLGPTWGAKLAATFLVGMGHGLAAVVFNRRFLTEFGPKGAAMVGVVNAAYAIGAIAGPFGVVALSGNVALVFGLCGVLALLLIAVVQPSGQRAQVLPFRGLINWHWAIMGLTLLSAIVEVGITGFGPAALIAIGWSGNATATLVSGFFVTFLIGRLSLYWLSNWISSPRLYALGMAGAALCLGVATMGFPAIGFVSAGLFIGVFFPTHFVWVSSVLGADTRVASAAVALSLGATALTPLILAPALQAWGITSIFAVLTGAASLGTCVAVIALWMLRNGQVAPRGDKTAPRDRPI